MVEDLPALIEAMKEKLSEISTYMEIGEGTIEVSETEDKDWANNWKEFFKPFRIGDLSVIPSWKREEAPQDEKVLFIDPGSAFGTGMHETTRLCIGALKEYVKENDQILDIGTGSGILGIVGLLYGAGSVTATDLDPCAKDAVAENLALNGFSEKDFALRIGNLITDEEVRSYAEGLAKGGYEIVMANILAEVLLSLTPVAATFLKPGGIYITSGILEGKEELVADACKKAGLTVLDIRADGEWRCVIAQR